MFFVNQEYKAYYRVIKNKNNINLYSSKSKIYNINKLVLNKFISFSKQYKNMLMNWIKLEITKKLNKLKNFINKPM